MFCYRNAPHPVWGAKWEKKRENEVIDEGVTAIKELQQTLVL